MPGFNAIASAWLLLLVPPLVALYFLKLKRPRLEIPSLVLWRRVLNDHRVNSPFQRFRRNLLLWLQLLLLLLLILAAMQPYRRGDAQRVTNLPVLIDTSASMAALDRPGGTSRLDEARRRVRAIIDNLLPDQHLCLIGFDRTARRLTGFTNNPSVLGQALDEIRVAEVGSDIEDAMRLTQALAQTNPFDQAIMYSDGNFPARTDFEQSFRLDYQRLEPAGANIGISALNARRSAGGRWDLFVTVESSAADPMSATVVVSVDGARLDPEPVTVDQGSDERLVYTIAAEQRTWIEVRLEPDGFDSLDLDNVAYLDLGPARPLEVHVPAALGAVRAALGADEVRLHTAGAAAASAGTALDLVISNDERDLALEAPIHMVIGVVPADLRALLSIRAGTDSSILDWQRNAPLLEHVQLAEVLLADSPTLDAENGERELDNLGYEVLAHARDGPLLVQRRQGERVDYDWLVDLERTTLPFRPGFPIMMLNLVRQAMHLAGLAEVRGARTGVLPALAVAPDADLLVRPPGGPAREVRSDAAGRLAGVAAPSVGRYEILAGGTVIERVGVSLLDDAETRLAAVDAILFDELTVNAAPCEVRVNRSYWPSLALLALLVLLLEWWLFQRRPGGWRR